MIVGVAAGGGGIESWFDLLPLDSLSGGLPSTWLKATAVPTVAHVVALGVVLAIALPLALKAAKNFGARAEARLSPRTFFELILDGLMSLTEGQMGRKKAEVFLPLIGTLAVFIFFSNAMALVPGGLPPTQNLNTTLAPALVVFFATHWVGVRENGAKDYFLHLMGPIQRWFALPLMLLLLVIETIGHLARPMSLSLRLMGNMFGDHAVLAKFLGMFPFLLPIPNMVLGCVVVIVQTMVFCILSVIYISMALAHEDDHH